MASWADRVEWGRLGQMGLFLAAGLGCIVLGQIPMATVLITAAIAQQLPNNIVGAVKKAGGPGK